MNGSGFVYYVEQILPRINSASVTKSGKLIRCETSEGTLFAVNSSNNRKTLTRHGFGL